MPELPEVEVVRRELSQALPAGNVFTGVTAFRKDLRFKIPVKELNAFQGEKLLALERVSKYIVWRFAQGLIVTHLGMTGRWHKGPKLRTHDHLTLHFADQDWTYEDPRRFGFVEVYSSSEKFFMKRLKAYGQDVTQGKVDIDLVLEKSKGRKLPIKALLMNQSVLVGIGNIYASEILFRARLNPFVAAEKLKKDDWQRLIVITKDVFSEAILRGGSSISDFSSAYGAEGSFQDFHQVYDKEHELCVSCKLPIRMRMLAGRSTFWCPKCQPKRGRKNS